MTTKDEIRITVEALKLALTLALEALEETRNALAWFYDSYPQDVTKKGNELLPHVETVLTTIREALASKSEALYEQPAPEPTTKQKVDAAVEQYAKTGNGRVLEAALGNIIINETLDKMAKNARELGLDYEPPCKTGSQCTSKCQQCEQPAQQEPVAVKQIAEALRKHGLTLVKTAHSYHVMDLGRIEAQTTSPPIEATPLASQRSVKPWVGLTAGEIHRALDEAKHCPTDLDIAVAEIIEAKLREKNA